MTHAQIKNEIAKFEKAIDAIYDLPEDYPDWDEDKLRQDVVDRFGGESRVEWLYENQPDE